MVGQSRFTNVDDALAYWLWYITRHAGAKDWTTAELDNQIKNAEAIHGLWQWESGILATIKAGGGIRFTYSEWEEEREIAAAWGFWGELAKLLEFNGDHALAKVAATAAISSHNALERARAQQWDAQFLQFGAATVADLEHILTAAGEALPSDPVTTFKLGLGVVAAIGLVWLWNR